MSKNADASQEQKVQVVERIYAGPPGGPPVPVSDIIQEDKEAPPVVELKNVALGAPLTVTVSSDASASALIQNSTFGKGGRIHQLSATASPADQLALVNQMRARFKKS